MKIYVDKCSPNNFDLETFFSAKVKNYKEIASVYTLIESYNSDNIVNPDQIVNNKITLLEHLTKKEVNLDEVKEDVLKEFESYDKDLKILTYKVLLEKFNDKYKDLSDEQKIVLKEFINSVDSTSQLKDFYNSKVIELKEVLSNLSKNIKDKATEIKVLEVSKLLNELDKNSKISNDNLVDLLQYFELVKEIKLTNEVL